MVDSWIGLLNLHGDIMNEESNKDKTPECIYFENDIPICATFEHGIGEWLDIEENYDQEYNILEIIETCIKCGAYDVSYEA